MTNADQHHLTQRFSRVSRSLLNSLLFGLFVTGPIQAADGVPGIGLKLIADGIAAPVALSSLADGSGRLLLADQAGLIYLLMRDGSRQAQPFLDIRDRLVRLNQGMDERGISGLALSPRFKTDRKFYVVYNAALRAGAPSDWSNTMRLSEFRAPDQVTTVALPDSERILLEIDKPD